MGKVLILSDKPILKKKEEETLARDNIQIKALSNYQEDLRSTIKENFDLVIINNNLRGVDSNQLCHQIRSSSKAILILLGDKAEWEMWEKCHDIGFNRYYRKPIEPIELAIRIKLLLAKLGKAGKTEVQAGSNGVHTEADHQAKVPVPEQDGDIAVAEQDRDTAYQADSKPTPVQQNTPNVWQNPKVAKLLSSLLSGKITRINPEIDLQYKDGFSYREADEITETTSKETTLILESLANEGILIKENFEKILLSPDGSVQMIPVKRCPYCDSSTLSRGRIIEHFACGHVGLEEDFVSGLKHICPKCRKELKLIGTDYRSPGMRYTCQSCQGIFPSPTIKFRCLKTGGIYDLEELRQVWLYSYHLNEAYRKRLEFELEPKKRLVEYLNRLGYNVQESVKLQGRSGATHTIDLLANMDDPIAKHTVAVGILAAPQDAEEVSIDALFGFDSKIYDIGIDHKIVLAIPRLTSEAAKFAKRQGIRVYGIEELRALLSRQPDFPEIALDAREHQTAGYESEPELAKLGPRGWLKWLLEKKGYHVTEKAKVIGRSGAEHVLELYAEKDDGIISHNLAAYVITNENMLENSVNEVVQFDTAAYDAGIADKVIVTIPKLNKEAKQFAEYQRIKVLEAKDLVEFSSKFLSNQVQADYYNQ